MKQSLVVAALAALAAGCGWVGPRPPLGRGTVRAYIVHHGEPTFKQLIADFQRRTGIRVQASFACRGTNLVSMAVQGGDGDVFITDSNANVRQLQEKGLGRSDPIPLGQVTPVLQVVKGNPKKIRSLDDLARPGVRVVLCHQGGCLGRVADRILAKNKLAGRVAPNIVRRAHGEVATAKAVDGVNADVAIMWSWVLLELGADRYEMVPIPAERNVADPIVAVLLKTGENPRGAERFVAFLRSGAARKALAEAGLRAKDGG